MRIRIVIGALAAAMLLGGWTFSGDRQGAYCLYDRDFTNCGYPTYAACLAAASAAGGYCGENPKYLPEPERRRRGR